MFGVLGSLSRIESLLSSQQLAANAVAYRGLDPSQTDQLADTIVNNLKTKLDFLNWNLLEADVVKVVKTSVDSTFAKPTEPTKLPDAHQQLEDTLRSEASGFVPVTTIVDNIDKFIYKDQKISVRELVDGTQPSTIDGFLYYQLTPNTFQSIGNSDQHRDALVVRDVTSVLKAMNDSNWANGYNVVKDDVKEDEDFFIDKTGKPQNISELSNDPHVVTDRLPGGQRYLIIGGTNLHLVVRQM